MTELPLAIDRLRAAVNGDDFEWEIDGGSPFDDAKALLAAFDEQKIEIERLRAVALAKRRWRSLMLYPHRLPPQPKENEMKKFWIVYGVKNSGQFVRYDTYDAAEDQAKRSAFNDRDNEFVIMEAVASTKQPVPEIDVVKL